MKVRLLVNLKTEDGTVYATGTVFESPLPDFITNNLAFPNIIQVTEEDVPVTKIEEEVVAVDAPAPKILKKKKV